MALDVITDALKRLSRDDDSASSVENQDFFCVEDAFLYKDISVTVDDIGKLSFPLSTICIENMIKTSSKAEFGKGETTVLDTSVRDTQMIPESKLTVDINNLSLAALLERIGSGLNIDKSSSLVPHLHNMLIYGPGQFFNKHRDSEKIKNMVATLVILLPSPHKGGDLIIEHNNKKHLFFSSHSQDIVKCVAFYSDCKHEVQTVTEGFRVALTYNVVLQSPSITDSMGVDERLNNSVMAYFAGDDNPKRLIYYLNHSYSKHSLKWDLLKGSDRTCGYALFVVAKHQGLIPCLALLKYQESYEVLGPYHDDELTETSTDLHYWVDENNIVCWPSQETTVLDSEVCYTVETTELLEPYKIDKDDGDPYGNSGATEDRWYRRACVVLLSKSKKKRKKVKHDKELKKIKEQSI